MRFNDIKPQFCIVIGGAGSGKNYFIEHNSTLSSYTMVDVDAIKLTMPVKDAIASIKPALIAAFENRENVVHPSTGFNLKAQENKIALARKYGYAITVILIDTPVEKAISQVRKRYREGGHDVSLDKIVSSNKIARENFQTLQSIADQSRRIS